MDRHHYHGGTYGIEFDVSVAGKDLALAIPECGFAPDLRHYIGPDGDT